MYRFVKTYRVSLSLLVALAVNTGPAMALPVSSGDILVADQGGTVHHYSASGADLGVFASGLGSPSWITTDEDGNIYVSEYTGSRITKFSPSGAILLTIDLFYRPGGVRVGSDGTIYVADYFGDSVYRYSAAGLDLGLFVTVPGLDPDFIAFDGSGYLYVTEFCCHGGRIRRISPTGVDLGDFITGISGVEGIAFDADGNLYAAVGSTIKKFSPSGVDLGTFATAGSNSYGLAFDSSGNLYVVDLSGTVRKFDPSGTSLGSFATGLSATRDLVVIAELDTSPPETTITGGPTGTIAVNSASFTWTGSDDRTPVGSLLYAFRLVPLEANFSAFGNATSTTYTGLGNGSYTFDVKAIDEAGNETAPPASRTFTVSLGRDLVVIAVTNPPGTAKRGSKFQVTDTVQNQGGVSTKSSKVRYYLSTNMQKDGGDKLLIGSHTVPGLAPGATYTKTDTVTIPHKVALGTYYLLACADYKNKVAESLEGNNCLTSATTIQVTRP